MKLQIEHLAPYLPYNLQVKHPIENEYYTLHCNSNNYGNVGMGVLLDKDAAFKPVLKSMVNFSEVVKEKFGEDNDKEFMYFFDDTFIDIDEIHNTQIDYLVYGAIVWLLKNHYDIFGLIDAGLAHDENLLPKI